MNYLDNAGAWERASLRKAARAFPDVSEMIDLVGDQRNLLDTCLKPFGLKVDADNRINLKSSSSLDKNYPYC